MTATRKRLTPHQSEVLERLTATSTRLARGMRYGMTRFAWVEQSAIGSVGALAHLVEKGYIEQRQDVGPRGGRSWSYRPVAE